MQQVELKLFFDSLTLLLNILTPLISM